MDWFRSMQGYAPFFAAPFQTDSSPITSKKWRISIDAPKPVNHIAFVQARAYRSGQRLFRLILKALAITPPMDNTIERRIENCRSTPGLQSLLHTHRHQLLTPPIYFRYPA